MRAVSLALAALLALAGAAAATPLRSPGEVSAQAAYAKQGPKHGFKHGWKGNRGRHLGWVRGRHRGWYR